MKVEEKLRAGATHVKDRTDAVCKNKFQLPAAGPEFHLPRLELAMGVDVQ